MNLLLDTHALLWWAAGEKMTPQALAAIANPDNTAYVSAASVWEIAIKTALGKLSIDGSLEALIDEDFESLDIALDDGRRAGSLVQHHRDPFDRMLIAQAISRDLTVVTRDAAFADYEVSILAA